MDNKTFGKYIKDIRVSRNLSLRQVDYMSKVTHSNLSMIENGIRKATPFVLKELAKVYHVEYVDLLQKAEYIDLATVEKVKDRSLVKVLGSVPAGIPLEMIEDVVDTEELSPSMLKGDREYFGLKVKGDSMNPDYLNGDTLIVQVQNCCESGDDCVVAINGDDATFKRVIKTDSGIILQPLNNAYTPIVFSKEEVKNKPVKILGVVRELRRKK